MRLGLKRKTVQLACLLGSVSRKACRPCLKSGMKMTITVREMKKFIGERWRSYSYIHQHCQVDHQISIAIHLIRICDLSEVKAQRASNFLNLISYEFMFNSTVFR